MHQLAIVTLTGAVSLLLLLSLVSMRRNGANIKCYNRKNWHHQPLEGMVNDSWLKYVLGTEYELFFLGFTQKQINAAKTQVLKSEDEQKQGHRFKLANHAMAGLYSDAEQTAGSPTVLSRLSDFLCNYALFLSLFCLFVALCTSYVYCPEWLKPYLNWCITSSFNIWSKRHECPTTKCVPDETWALL